MLVIYIILGIVLALFCVTCAFLLWGVNFSSKRGKTVDVIGDGPFSEIMKNGVKWVESVPKRRVSIVSRDGLKLVGHLIENDKTDVVFVLFHGYRSSAFHDFSGAVKMYFEMGYSLLLVDQRSHKDSEGKYITYGVKERYDCLDWCLFLKENFPNKKVFVDGISMGGATVLMACGVGLPDNVVGVIADSSYTSPYEIISKVAGDMKYPPKIVMPLLSTALKLVAGYDAKACDTRESVKQTDLPILLVHGKADSFVPFEMSVQTYEACRSHARLLLVDRADHGLSFLVDNEGVRAVLTEFIADVLSGKNIKTEN